MREYKMWIGGKWVSAASGKTLTEVNPATGEKIARVLPDAL
jgi:acyl-CoA reductase-like NAD-dependent aldehyde dehydrogenase